MRQYILRRGIYVIPTLVVVTVVVFLMLRFLPGDVVHQMLEGYAYAPTVEALRKELGLDKPLPVQYSVWIKDIFRGDLGHSLWTKQPIIQEFARRFPVTLELAILTILVSIIVGVGIGTISAIRQDSWADYSGRVFAIAMLAIPYFWLAVLVVVLPSIYLRWTPVWTYVPFTQDPLGNLRIMSIPALIFGLTRAGPVMRIMRSSMLEVMRQDYIRTAWAKGLSEQVVITRHALKNALIPVVSIIGIQMPFLIGGSVIMESIFRLPGVGQFFFEALIRRDYPVVQGINLILASFVILLNLAVDLSYAYLDPRIRYR